jgi:hypothetical protein
MFQHNALANKYAPNEASDITNSIKTSLAKISTPDTTGDNLGVAEDPETDLDRADLEILADEFGGYSDFFADL